jgi:hypothetical protein
MMGSSVAKTTNRGGIPTAKAATFNKNLPLPEKWAQVVIQIQQKSPSLGAKLEHVSPLELTDSLLTLGVSRDKKFLCEQLSEPKTVKDIEAHLLAFWGIAISVKCQQIENQSASPHELQQKKVQEHQNSVQKEVENHPLIQKTQKTFKAQIKAIKENQ